MTADLLKLAHQFRRDQVQVELTYRDSHNRRGLRALSNTHHRLVELIAFWTDSRDGWARHRDFSIEGLASTLGVKRRWMQRILRDLEQVTVIESRRGGGRLRGGKGRASDYRINPQLLERGTIAVIFRGKKGGPKRPPYQDEKGGVALTNYSGRPAALQDEKYSGRPAAPGGRTQGRRRARARARDGMRFASPAGSARDDFLSSRASLGPGNGRVEEAPTPGRGQPAIDYRRWDYTRWEPGDPCPICGRPVEGAYKEHVCPVSRPKPSPTESESPMLPLLSEAELLAEHERLLALERARMEVAEYQGERS